MTTVLYVHYFDGKPLYVGIGTPSRPFNFWSRNEPWRALRRTHGNPDVVLMGEFGDRESACRAEVHLIASLRELGFDLANLTSGGEAGGTLSPETRRKMSESHSARVRTPEELDAAAERSRATWRDPVKRQSMLDAIRASVRSKEALHAAAERSRASMADPARRKVIADKLRAHWSDPELRKRESAAKKGLMQTSERREACAAAARALHADPEFRARYLAGRGTPVECIETGERFATVVSAAASRGEPASRLRAHLLQGRENFAGQTWRYLPKGACTGSASVS